jgi:hypothetical protein
MMVIVSKIEIRVETGENINKPNNINLVNMIAEMEKNIKILEITHSNKIVEFERYIKIYLDKKQVLLINPRNY